MYKVIESFCGPINGTTGELIEINDKELAKVLVKDGLVEEVAKKATKKGSK